MTCLIIEAKRLDLTPFGGNLPDCKIDILNTFFGFADSRKAIVWHYGEPITTYTEDREQYVAHDVRWFVRAHRMEPVLRIEWTPPGMPSSIVWSRDDHTNPYELELRWVADLHEGDLLATVGNPQP